jgi:hypothetical protein
MLKTKCKTSMNDLFSTLHGRRHNNNNIAKSIIEASRKLSKINNQKRRNVNTVLKR